MINIIRPEEITDTLTEEQLLTLAVMANSESTLEAWLDVYKILSSRQKFQIYFKRIEIYRQVSKTQLAGQTQEEKNEQLRKTNFSSFDGKPKGNMWSQAMSPGIDFYEQVKTIKLNPSSLKEFVKIERNYWYEDQSFYEKLAEYIKSIEIKKCTFDGYHSILGLRRTTEFKINEQLFTSGLQYVLFEKADFFVYPEIKQRVLNTENIDELEVVGKTILFDEDSRVPWANYLEMILARYIKKRWDTDAEFRQELLQTMGQSLICICESRLLGFKQDSMDSIHPGKNLLGKYLTLIRVEKSGFY